MAPGEGDDDSGHGGGQEHESGYGSDLPESPRTDGFRHGGSERTPDLTSKSTTNPTKSSTDDYLLTLYRENLTDYINSRKDMKLPKLTTEEEITAKAKEAMAMGTKLMAMGCKSEYAMHLSCLVLFDLAILVGK